MPVRRSREQWEELVAEWQASGLSQRAFCKQNQVNYASFRNYVPKKAEAREERLDLPLVEVGGSAADSGLIQILWPDGTQLRFPPVISPTYLTAVIQVLRP